MSRDSRILCTLILGASVIAAGCGVDSSKKKSRALGGSTSAPVTPGNQLPEPRAEHTATVLPSGDIFVAGGVDVMGNPLASTVIISQGTATRGPDMATPRVGHSATYDVASGAVIIAGGQSDAAGTQMLNSCELFDEATGTIAPGPNLNASRSHHTAVMHLAGGNAMILFAGGMGTPLGGQPAYRASAEVLNVATGQSTALTATLPAAQAHASGALLDTGDVLIVGGRDASGSPAPCARYNVASGTFTPITQAASTVSDVALAAQGSTIIVAGGDNGSPVSATEVYDSATQAYTSGPALSNARSGATGSFLTATASAIVGGRTATGASGDVDVFAAGSPASIVAGPALALARFGHTASVLPTATDRVIVVGGYDSTGLVTASIEEVDLAATLAGITPPPPPIPPPPAGAITSYPYFENFDAGVGVWTNSTADDFDWTPNTGGTTSFDTGPSSDHTSGTGQYIYTEASSPNYPAKTAIIDGPVFAGPNALEVRFWYHMYSGSTTQLMGTLSMDVSTDDGVTWTTGVWTRTGDQGDLWQEAVVDLSSYAPNHVKIRFVGTTDGYASDMAIDDLSVSDVFGPVTPPPPPPPPPATPVTLPYTENFDAGLGQWSNITGGDDFDWDPRSGTTPSTGTGPSSDHTSGSGQYIYTEATSPNNPAKVAIIEGPTFANFTSLELRFWYHMLGDDPTVGTLTMGTLNLDVSTDNGVTWTQGVWTMTGNQGDLWHEAIVNLNQFAGQSIKVRFRGVTDSFKSDMAIDDISAR